jgi:hypothetical protein
VSALLAILGSILVLAIAAAGGGLVLLRARIGSSPLAMAVRALLGLALLASFYVHVAVGLTLALLIAAASWRGHNLEDAVLEDARKPTAIALGAIVLVVAVVLLRPPVPIFHGESALLALARSISLGDAIAAGERALVLPVMASALALGSDATTSLAIGGEVVVLVSFALFALLVARAAESSFEEALPLIVLASAPFAWIHLRSVSVDLSVGLCAGSLALGIDRAARGDRLGAPSALTAALLLGMADHGIVLAVAVALAFSMAEKSRDARRTALLAVLCLALSAIAGRWTAFGALAIEAAPSSAGRLVVEALRHVTDIQTWGLVPAVALAALVATARRTASAEARVLAVALLLAPAMMLVVLVLDAELRALALEGAVLDRLALSLLPLGALLIARSLPRAVR